MCGVGKERKRQSGGDGREIRTKMKERALGGISRERRAKDIRVGREEHVL